MRKRPIGATKVANNPSGHNTIIVQGSARADGNTSAAVERVRNIISEIQIVHLCALDIQPFTYGEPALDDFRGVIDDILKCQKIVFATPVYWYAMSGLMKALFDRLTDIISNPATRRLGRALAGRDVWLLATGTDDELPQGFSEPFRRTCSYFDMQWQGEFYIRIDKDAELWARDLTQANRLAVDIRDHKC